MVRFICFTYPLETKNVIETLKDKFLINAMQDKLEQFNRNQVWTLVPRLEEYM